MNLSKISYKYVSQLLHSYVLIISVLLIFLTFFPAKLHIIFRLGTVFPRSTWGTPTDRVVAKRVSSHKNWSTTYSHTYTHLYSSRACVYVHHICSSYVQKEILLCEEKYKNNEVLRYLSSCFIRQASQGWS